MKFATSFRCAAKHFLRLALLVAAMPVQADDLAGILARIETAYGVLGEVRTIRQTGRTFSKLRGEGAMERLWAAPDRFRIRLDYPTGTELRRMAGERAWQGAEPKAGPFLQAMRLQAARSRLPWNLLATDRVSWLGSSTEADGRTIHTLVLALEPPLRLVVDVDAASARVLRSIGTGIGNLEFVTEFGEFRRIGSHLVATREEHYAMGRQIGRSLVEGLDFPPDPGDQAFVPPR